MLLKTTTSVCATCLTPVAARVVERHEQVFLHKTCPRHGEEEVLIASDARLYWKAGDSCAGGGCCSVNYSCTLIFEITEQCNLTCPTCFSGSSPHHTWRMSVAEFSEKLDRLIAQGKGDAGMVQFSGGEPTIHPDLERMVEICFERGVRNVFVNTNGIRMATDAAFVRRLAAIDHGKERLQFYLQFDGFDPGTYAQIRGARGLLSVKRRAIENTLDAGLFVLPVMTVTRGINLEEIGTVVGMTLENHPGDDDRHAAARILFGPL